MVAERVGNVLDFSCQGGSSIDLISLVPAGQVVDLAQLAPDIRCRDVVLSLQKMFNLVFDAYIDNEGQKRIKIDTWNDYMNAGQRKTGQTRLTTTRTLS